MFKYDYNGVSESGKGFDPIPEGDYSFVITKVEERRTKNKDPMVHVTCKVLEGTYAGRIVWHNVNFLPKENKGAGMSKHFLHVIGQPFEGMVDVEPKDWIDATFRAHAKVTEFNGKPQNELDEIYDAEPEAAAAPSGEAGGDAMEEVPF